MRFPAAPILAAALVLAMPCVASSVGAKPAARSAPADSAIDVCESLRGDADSARFVCLRDSASGTWGALLDPPAPGARDLTLTATYVDARGARTQRVSRVEGAAAWFPTIAPLERAARVAPNGALSVDLVRLGFREYPVAHVAFDPPAAVRAWPGA